MFTSNVPGTTATVAVVQVATTAQRLTTDIGDHSVSLVVTAPGVAEVRFQSSLVGLTVYADVAALVAGTDLVAYVQQGSSYIMYLRLDRTAGQALNVTLDLTDPLGRTARTTTVVPFALPDPAPVLTNLNVVHVAPVVAGDFLGNVPTPADPARPWTLTIGLRVFLPPGPVQTRTFKVPSIATIASAAAMPTPAANPAQQFMIAQVAGTNPRQFIFWVRTAVRLNVAVQLTNFDGASTTIQKVSP